MVCSVQTWLLASAGEGCKAHWSACWQLAHGGTGQAGKRLLLTADSASLRGKRDYATLAILLGCGLRRAELTT
jgi:hypothetical protein